MTENENSNDTHDADNSHGEQGNEAHEHPKPVYDDVNIPVVVLLGVLSAILTFVAIAFVQGLYFSWQESMVMADWNSRILTPQEQTIVDQKQVRDGFYETKDGKIYVSAEVAAKKMIAGKKAVAQPKSQPETQTNTQSESQAKTQPKPPGPEADDKSKETKEDPKKEESDPKDQKKKDADPESAVTKGDAKTGDNK